MTKPTRNEVLMSIHDGRIELNDWACEFVMGWDEDEMEDNIDFFPATDKNDIRRMLDRIGELNKRPEFLDELQRIVFGVSHLFTAFDQSQVWYLLNAAPSQITAASVLAVIGDGND